VDVAPQLRPVGRRARQFGGIHLVPVEHRLVVAPAVEVQPGGAEELVDEGVHLVVGGAPVEAARRVFAMAVERDGAEVDERPTHQAGHTPMMTPMTTSVTSWWAQLSTVSPTGRRSN